LPAQAVANVLLAQEDLRAFRDASAAGVSSTAELGREPEGLVLRLDAPVPLRNAHDAQLEWLSRGPIAKDDVFLIRFIARATRPQAETGEGTLQAVAKNRVTTRWFRWPTVAVPTEWTVFELPLVSDQTLQAEDLVFSLCFGHSSQTLEVARYEVINFGKSIPLSALPFHRITYQGREPDAAWRAAAAERIEHLRKADATVRVRDAAGRPVPEAQVSVRLARHAFPFGTAVSAAWLARTGPDADRYRQIVERNFNAVVFENDLKWANGDPNRVANVNASLAWLEPRGIPVRGHALVWPGVHPQYLYLPQDILDAVKRGDLDHIRARVDRRLRHEIHEFDGRIRDWDVVNEANDNKVLQNVLGGDLVIADWFRAAREAAPGVRLVLNDYSMLSGGASRAQGRIDAWYELIRSLLEVGAPIDAIGEQAHFTNTPGGIDRTFALLDRFSSFGLPIVITEFDFATADEQLQADYVRDFYTALFSHPSVDGIYKWGFWERAHWKPQAALWRRDFSEKPAARAYRDLIRREWRTEASGRTDASGAFTLRGFKGDYTVTVTRPGRPATTHTATLSANGDEFLITLP
jgi:GH35 family endo-1,4-beta-xylanase